MEQKLPHGAMRMRVGYSNAIANHNPNSKDQHSPGNFFIQSCNLFQCSDYVNFRPTIILNGIDKLFITFVKTKTYKNGRRFHW